MSSFELSFTAEPDDIDELGHVNNAVWVRWIQDVATAHWYALATPEQHQAVIWVVIRHEIDSLRALGPGGTVMARTWIPAPPRGARFDRHVEFTGADGRIHVRARTTWAMLDRASGRPLRVTPELAARFQTA